MDLPDDLTRWVSVHFDQTQKAQALEQLSSAVTHDGKHVEPRLLRCAAFISGGDLKKLAQPIRDLQVDWRDVILQAEYTLAAGKKVRLRDFNNAMDAATNVVPIPIQCQKYISLKTFRKNGTGVPTPVWFGEDGTKLYVMTRHDMGKTKRIRNSGRITVAPCTIRGKVTGPEFPATARILPPEDHARARAAINRKYWMARLPLLWYRTDTYFEISFD